MLLAKVIPYPTTENNGVRGILFKFRKKTLDIIIEGDNHLYQTKILQWRNRWYISNLGYEFCKENNEIKNKKLNKGNAKLCTPNLS